MLSSYNEFHIIAICYIEEMNLFLSCAFVLDIDKRLIGQV
uniref:Putative oxidoreductase At4g09670-like n=1 Tax=Rhizophora mucronata TaxID=61149 RepID=A0A2P2IVX8_RHIMU